MPSLNRQVHRAPVIHTVWILSLGLAVVSALIGLLALPGIGRFSDLLVIHPLVLVAMFVATEFLVVHIEFRSEAGRFSFFEVPLVLGLLYTAPEQLWLASLASGIITFALIRRQPAIKWVFNVANSSLKVGLTVLLAGFLLGGVSPVRPLGWLVVISACIVTASLEIVFVTAAITLTEGRPRPSMFKAMLGFAVGVAAANVLQALIAALLLLQEPAAVVLLASLTTMLYLANKAFEAEREQRERVEFLYQSTRALRDTMSDGDAVAGLLVEAARMFRAEQASLVLFAAPETDQPAVEYRLGTDTTSKHPLISERLAIMHGLADWALESRMAEPGSLPTQMATLGLRDGMVGTLRTDKRRVGVLIVGDRLGSISTFTPDDLRLFRTLVDQSAVALENDQLEQTLSELRRLETELAHQAAHDALTGLANRALLSQRLDSQLAESSDLALLYIDLDDFKPVNDTLGHAAGDELLVECARRLHDAVRSDDLVARLGGDEFAAVIRDPKSGEAVAERILASLSEPFVLGDKHARVGASIGLALATDQDSASELLGKADAAMYAAKQGGKGGFAIYEPAMQLQMSQQQELRTKLRLAVERDEFIVLYQPIVDLATRSIVGAEALVRWRPEDQDVPPAKFIEEAERAGLIVGIDRIVFEHAVADLEQLRALSPGFFVSSNLSARQLSEPDLVDYLRGFADRPGVGDGSMVIEITETALVRNPERAITTLNEIKELGLRLALDDFGTGYSSLSHLRSFPVDILKVARPFVEALTEKVQDPFVKAMVDLGQTLEITVLAEGIETEEQYAALLAMGTVLGQGYLLAKPMSIGSLQRLVELGIAAQR
ncbi:MAG: EAL domain-containing protein [Acidimicrobiales bacterium]